MDEPTGRKDDTGKLLWHLLPLAPVEDIIKVLMFGAKKYGEFNWQRVENPLDRYWDAAIRHLTSWKKGEIQDPESDLHHLAHAACCLLFLLHFENKNNEKKNDTGN